MFIENHGLSSESKVSMIYGFHTPINITWWPLASPARSPALPKHLLQHELRRLEPLSRSLGEVVTKKGDQPIE